MKTKRFFYHISFIGANMARCLPAASSGSYRSQLSTMDHQRRREDHLPCFHLLDIQPGVVQQLLDMFVGVLRALQEHGLREGRCKLWQCHTWSGGLSEWLHQRLRLHQTCPVRHVIFAARRNWTGDLNGKLLQIVEQSFLSFGLPQHKLTWIL